MSHRGFWNSSSHWNILFSHIYVLFIYFSRGNIEQKSYYEGHTESNVTKKLKVKDFPKKSLIQFSNICIIRNLNFKACLHPELRKVGTAFLMTFLQESSGSIKVSSKLGKYKQHHSLLDPPKYKNLNRLKILRNWVDSKIAVLVRYFSKPRFNEQCLELYRKINIIWSFKLLLRCKN